MAHATIYLADLREFDDETSARLVAWLSPAERQRYQRFVRPLRRRQFLAGRILLRQALALALDLPVSAFHFSASPGEAPRLVAPVRPETGFSISHSGSWAACAVSPETRLGLDIEVIDPARDAASLARQVFSGDENRCLDALPESQRLQEFHRLWCRKEACCKLGRASGQCIDLSHPSLAIALCSAAPLAVPPVLVPAVIAPDLLRD